MDDATLETVVRTFAKLIMTVIKMFRLDNVRDAFTPRSVEPRVPERPTKCDLNAAAVRTGSLFYLVTYYCRSMASLLVGLACPDQSRGGSGEQPERSHASESGVSSSRYLAPGNARFTAVSHTGSAMRGVEADLMGIKPASGFDPTDGAFVIGAGTSWRLAATNQ